MKRILVFLFLVVCGTAAAQIGAYWVQFTKLQTNLDSTLLDYNTLGRAKFLERLVGNCANGSYRLDPKDVEIQEDRAQNEVRVEIRYREEMKVLMFPVKPDLVARGKTLSYGM